MLGYLSGSEEPFSILKEENEISYTHTSGPTLNILGSEAGTVFSHSVLDIGADGPLVILANENLLRISKPCPRAAPPDLKFFSPTALNFQPDRGQELCLSS